LLSVGSVLHFAKDNDVVWGAGRNGKINDGAHEFRNLDVRMVRGPLTRAFLLERGIKVPEVFGDPALLTARLFPEYRSQDWSKRYERSVILNLNDAPLRFPGANAINPCAPVTDIIEAILRSRLLISSSLHGIVVAEAFGVPVVVLRSPAESKFKYDDYFLGTGRSDYPIYDTIDEAVKGESPKAPVFSAEEMFAAFPFELFGCN
jgi:pyruvyltransferase